MPGAAPVTLQPAPGRDLPDPGRPVGGDPRGRRGSGTLERSRGRAGRDTSWRAGGRWRSGPRSGPNPQSAASRRRPGRQQAPGTPPARAAPDLGRSWRRDPAAAGGVAGRGGFGWRRWRLRETPSPANAVRRRSCRGIIGQKLATCPRLLRVRPPGAGAGAAFSRSARRAQSGYSGARRPRVGTASSEPGQWRNFRLLLSPPVSV